MTKDTTDFINVIEKKKVKKRTFLVSMGVISIFTNIPQNEGIEFAERVKIFTKQPTIQSYSLPARNA